MKRSILFLTAMVLNIFLLPSTIHAGNNNLKDHTHQTIILKNATVIACNNSMVLAKADIVIRGEKIIAINTGKTNSIESKELIYDLKGKFIITGLIESHNHTMPFIPETAYKNALYHGITTIRDMAGDGSYLKDLQAAVNNYEAEAPEIYFSALMGGPELIRKDKRVQMMTPDKYKPGTAPWMMEIVAGSDIKKIITESKEFGAAGIKIYSHISAELVKKLTCEARRQGLKVWTHSLIGPATVEDVVSSGVDSVSHAQAMLYPDNWSVKEHGSFGFDDKQSRPERLKRIFNLMKKHNTFLDPTLLLFKRMINNSSISESEKIRKTEVLFSLVRLAHQSGVRIVAGTDIFFSQKKEWIPELHTELEILVKDIGLTPYQALKAATINGAEVLGIEKTHGSICIGKVANIVVLNSNPLKEITNTTNIDFVMKRGKIYKKIH